MKIKNKKGSIAIFVLIALLFFATSLLIIYGANINGIQTVDEKSEILKNIYQKNTGNESIENQYNKKMGEEDPDIGLVYSADQLIFNGNNYIDTGIKLFNSENINKDFEISFDVDSIGTNANLNTLVNAKDESSDPYPGFCLRYSDENSTLALTANSSTSNRYKATYISVNSVQKVVIKRIANMLYYSFNNNNDQRLIDFMDITRNFNGSLTFGASIDGSGSPFRYFAGQISNVKVKLFDESTRKYAITRTNSSFVLNGPAVFNGKNYLDTGLYLFNESNKNKDFEISFDIVKFGQNENLSAIFNSLDEDWSPWPGIVFRINGENLELKANSTSSNKVSATINKSNLNSIKIKKIDGKIYYSINNGSDTELINFSDLARNVSAPLTFGASLDGNSSAFRFFKGTLSNIRVQITN